MATSLLLSSVSPASAQTLPVTSPPTAQTATGSRVQQAAVIMPVQAGDARLPAQRVASTPVRQVNFQMANPPVKPATQLTPATQLAPTTPDIKGPRPDDVSKPNPNYVFRVDSNMSLDVRMADELFADELARYNEELAKNPKTDKKRPTREQYRLPESRPAGQNLVYQPKTYMYPPSQLRLEPGFVVHRRLYFEELNAERYGWDLGLLSPVVSTAYFYKDALLLPAKLASNFRERYDTNMGKCEPGSPVPYFLYPPEITITGATFGAAAIVGVALLLP